MAVTCKHGRYLCAECASNRKRDQLMNQDSPLGKALAAREGTNDPVSNPKHYTSHPSGVECIQITEHCSFNIGNAIKYLWRADLKGSSNQDLEKAIWYIQRELSKRAKD